MRFSSRLDPSLVAAVQRMDVERLSVADVWRQAGLLAVECGLPRPGYHSIRRLVHEERHRRVERRDAIAQALDEAWSFTGANSGTLLRRLDETRRQ